MSIPLFYAMSKTEIRDNFSLPDQIAWMSCHFSAGGTALADVPGTLPSGSILILDDRIPFRNHDTSMICNQMWDAVKRLSCSGVLLDFQRPPTVPLLEFVGQLIKQLPCPVGVPASYSPDWNCPVFLPPVPPQVLVAEYLKPFHNREIWLEVALDGATATIVKDGCSFSSVPFPKQYSSSHYSPELHCHYHIDTNYEQVQFSFFRTKDDVLALYEKAGKLGAALAIGLCQELL